MVCEKKKLVWQQWIAMAFFVLIGAACGILMVKYMDSLNAMGSTALEIIFELVILFVGMYVALFAQLVIHETGHLIFGLASGYKFHSFRILNFMWIKENGKLKLRRFSLAGTGGQCLMSPPDMVDGKLPVALYNFGGALMNIIASAVFWGLYLLCSDIPLLSVFLLMLVMTGIAFAVMNGVPMRMGVIDNDGYNALSLCKNKAALRSSWVQLKAAEQIAKGVRLKDMPNEWFGVPADEEMKNSMVAVMGVFACNRLMDEQKFEEANALMKHLLEIDSGIMGLHRSLMICDCIYCELICGNVENASTLLTKEQKKFMKGMKKFPSVLRTNYAYALLREKGYIKTESYKEAFKKFAKTYPYPSDVQSERELMEIAERIDKEKCI